MNKLVLSEKEAKNFVRKFRLMENDCWNWIGCITKDGYGQVRLSGKGKRPYRILYEAMRGDIPDKLTLDHLCRNRACVNPDHLEAVSMHENILRGNGFAAVNARKTYCLRGHELIKENVFKTKIKRRQCKRCISFLRKQKVKELTNN